MTQAVAGRPGDIGNGSVMDADAVAAALKVDVENGLSAREAAMRSGERSAHRGHCVRRRTDARSKPGALCAQQYRDAPLTLCQSGGSIRLQASMNLSSSTRARRRSAVFAVLLVWLFAVAAGAANACLLESPGSHSRSAAPGWAKTGQAPAVPAEHLGVADDDDDGAHTSKESCLKVCDERSKAPVKLHTAFDLTDPGMAPLVATVWNAAAPVVWGSRLPADLQRPIAGPPLRVRYSRLAL